MRLVAMFGSTPSRFPLSQPMLSHFHDESLYSLYSSVLLSFFLFQQNYNIFLRDILKTDSHVFFSHFRKSQKKIILDFYFKWALRTPWYERPGLFTHLTPQALPPFFLSWADFIIIIMICRRRRLLLDERRKLRRRQCRHLTADALITSYLGLPYINNLADKSN